MFVVKPNLKGNVNIGDSNMNATWSLHRNPLQSQWRHIDALCERIAMGFDADVQGANGWGIPPGPLFHQLHTCP